ncbi:ABC transporter substrate-binding protein [Phytopseudomonas punonensis]|uniref:ABC-type Fe3+-hydroxamate transport system, substrate-binding protein n=1 Tax=Phytopseudomonas punonensis TaxID=1220495 RepID=A0A1M7IK41_9GAMM|nr:ABC transporter substrate-binding protein [Pseudomonas punonensis]SHM40978.1 ABC-type Fe3+-hydroxamate transport system, substrate-binding protein [Pseudomonas punonensis]
MNIISQLALLVTASAISLSAIAAPKQIEDVLGRKVTIESPAKRVMLGFYFEDYLAVSGERGAKDVVGLSREAWEGWRPSNWALHVKHDPSIKDIADVGEVEVQSFSIEKVLALNPDVVVLADWQYKGLGADAERLEKLGIPVVVVDYNAQTVERHVASTLVFGEITGHQARAQEIADLYKTAIEDVQKRIATAGKPKPRVYVEFGNKGPSEYSFTYGKNMWGSMIDLAQGDNIAAPFVQWWGPINPEQVLASNPQVVLIAGTESTKVPGSLLIGEGVSLEQTRATLAGFTQREGWQNLDATKGKRLYGVYQGASRSITDFAAIQYLAKAFYPELFSDIDPAGNYREFYRKYLSVTPEGTFFTGL